MNDSDSLVVFRETALQPVPVRVSQMVARHLSVQAERTRAAYEHDLAHFAKFTGCASVDEAIDRLVQTDTAIAQDVVLSFQQHLVELGLAASTINRRMSALRSVLKLARAVGATQLRLDMIRNLDAEEKTRDVRGPGLAAIREIIAVADADESPAGLRDATLMRWLIATAIRRNELRMILLTDFRYGPTMADVAPPGWEGAGLVLVQQKRKRNKHPIGLSQALVDCTMPWLAARGHAPGALFCSLDRRYVGRTLGPSGLNQIVRRRAVEAGFVDGKLPDGRSITPHGFRHTSITEVYRKRGQGAAQAFARHSNPRTTARYNDEAMLMALEAQSLVFESLQ